MNGTSPLSRVAIRLSGSGTLEDHQRPAEALDVRALPRFPGDQILGNDARFGGLAHAEVGVGELRLRFVHRGFETAIHTDFDELEERGI